MNALVEQKKAALVTGAEVAPIVPRTLEESFRLASALSASGMAPASLNTPEKVMVAMLAGAELGLPPFQALQSFAVINGKPALWGDGLIAVVRSNGFKVKEWLEGDGDDLTAWCTVTRPDNAEEITRSFSVADAKKANLWGKAGPWQTSPKRMLQMRARGFACRDGAADVLRGFQLREEVEDYADIPQRGAPPAIRSDVRARLEARQTPSDEGFSSSFRPEPEAEPADAEFVERAEAAEEIATSLAHDAETGEIIEAELEAIDDTADEDEFPGDRPSSAPADGFDAVQWAADAHRKAKTFTHEPALKKWWNADETKRDRAKLEASNPGLSETLIGQVRSHGSSLPGAI